MTTFPPPRLSAMGRRFFGVSIAFFGLQQLMLGAFVTRALPAWPAWMPLQLPTVYVTGALLVAAGIAIIAAACARRIALGIGVLFLLAAILLPIPEAVRHPGSGLLWTNAGKSLVLGTGALAVAALCPREEGSPIDRLMLAASRRTLGAFMVFCGLEHFWYLRFVVQLVPTWLPAAQGWAIAAGILLILGGIGLNLRRWAALAAWWSGLMIFAWVWLVHLPRAWANLHDANESTALFEALAMAGLGFIHSAIAVRETEDTPASPPTRVATSRIGGAMP